MRLPPDPLKGPFQPGLGQESADGNAFRWPCGCAVVDASESMTVRACCAEHDLPLDRLVSLHALMAGIPVERVAAT